MDEIRNRVQGLRYEIEDLRNGDQQQRLSRQSQMSMDSQKQREARVARKDELKQELDEIKQELVKLGRGMKRD